jgi:hypothetical protein
MDRPIWFTNPWVHSWWMFVWKKWWNSSMCDTRWSSMEGKGWWSPSPVEIVLTVGRLCQSFLHIWHLHSTKLRCRLNLLLFKKKDYFFKKEPDFFKKVKKKMISTAWLTQRVHTPTTH